MQQLLRAPFFIFLLVSILLRGLSFFVTVIDHDESTYLVIAQQLLHGKLIYVDLWDTKPMGIFLIFAAVLSVFGHSIVALRCVGALMVALTAYLLYKTKLQLGAEKKVALYGGAAYILLFSAYRFGMAINTELYFNFFVMLGAWLFFRFKKHPFRLLAGLAWGLGFIVKYVVLFDVFAIVLVVVVLQWVKQKELKWKEMIGALLLVGIGFSIPFLSCNAYYYFNGHYAEFYEATFVVPGRYTSTLVFEDAIHFVLKFHLKFLPAMLLFYLLLIKNWSSIKAGELKIWLPVAWFVIVWIPVVLPGKYFEHYYGQLLLPLSWLLPEVFSAYRNDWNAWVLQWQQKVVGIALVVVAALIFGNQTHFFKQEDTSRKIAEVLQQKLKPTETIYAGKKLQAVYFLLDVAPPTKYIHPTLLTFSSHIRTLGIDADEEFRNILEKKPRFVFFKAPHPNALFNAAIIERYERVETLSKEVVLYEEKKQDLTNAFTPN
jgi:4-amino-4-deoxy-L-arabinose transferase-like glycosyltransferase